LNRQFSKEVQIANKCIKNVQHKKEMQIKMTLKVYLTPVSIAAIKKTNSNKFWQGSRGKGTLRHCCWEDKLV
jgi:hypothetical protein